jgi:hypothetical protein
MPVSVVREELEALDIRVQEVKQLLSGGRDKDPAKYRPLTPYFNASGARGPEVCKVRYITEIYGLRVSLESYVAPKGPSQCKLCQHFEQTQNNWRYAPRCVACGNSKISTRCSPWEKTQCYGCEGNHTASYRACIKGKEAKATLAKRPPEGV